MADQTGAQPGTFVEPYRSYNFKMEIDGITAGHFVECSGLGAKVEVIKYREAGQSQIVQTLPGPVDYATVTLRYGVTVSRELWDWFLRSIEGQADRKNVSIIMLDSAGVGEVMRWNLLDAWPCEWRGAPLDALARTVAIESVHLAFNRLERG
ncbi:MAG: hypothetical protein Fur0021_18120 [Candidatus Promineifilaceae bacterium]